MKRAIITAADFTGLRRRLPGKGLAMLVARIEAGFRAACGVESLTDDAIVVATLAPAKQTETERAGLQAVRACIGFREASEDAQGQWLDHLAIALTVADADHILGIEQRQRVRAGGAKTAMQRKRDATKDNAAIQRAAKAIRESDPGIKQEALAAMLADRGHGAKSTLLKKIARRRKT